MHEVEAITAQSLVFNVANHDAQVGRYPLWLYRQQVKAQGIGAGRSVGDWRVITDGVSPILI